MNKTFGSIFVAIVFLVVLTSNSFAGWSEWKEFSFGEDSENYYFTPVFSPDLSGERWHEMKFKKKFLYPTFTTIMQWRSDQYPEWHNFYTSNGSFGSAVCYSGSADVEFRIVFQKADSVIRKGYWAEYTDD